MKKAIQQSYMLLLIMGMTLLLSSFSLVPATEKAEEVPPLVHQEHLSRQQQKKLYHIEKRRQRLQKRLAKAKSKNQRQRLQQRLERLQDRENNVRPNSTIGLFGFVAGLAALVVLVLSLSITSIVLANLLFWGGIGIAALGLGLSILHLVLRQQDRDRYNRPGFAIAGLIISGLLLGLLLLAALGGSVEAAAATF